MKGATSLTYTATTPPNSEVIEKRMRDNQSLESTPCPNESHLKRELSSPVRRNPPELVSFSEFVNLSSKSRENGEHKNLPWKKGESCELLKLLLTESSYDEQLPINNSNNQPPSKTASIQLYRSEKPMRSILKRKVRDAGNIINTNYMAVERRATVVDDSCMPQPLLQEPYNDLCTIKHSCRGNPEHAGELNDSNSRRSPGIPSQPLSHSDDRTLHKTLIRPPIPECIPSNFTRTSEYVSEHLSSCCLLGELEEHPFTSTSWTVKERRTVIQRGKFSPSVEDFEFNMKMTDESLRKIIRWLTYCSKRKEFFCWPCLLFDKKGAWKAFGGTLTSEELEFHRLQLDHVTFSSYLENWEKMYTFQVPTSSRYIDKADKVVSDVASPLSAKSCHIAKLHTAKQSNFLAANSLSSIERNDLIIKGKLCQEKAYDCSKKWLTRCDHLKKWVCWPCLLFTNKAEWVISPTLVLQDRIISYLHGNSLEHMEACLQLAILEKSLCVKKVCSQPLNTSVEPPCNKSHLKCLIDAVCLLKKRKNNTSIPHTTVVSSLKFISSVQTKANWSFGEPISGQIAEGLVSRFYGHISRSVESAVRARILDEVWKVSFVSLILHDTNSTFGNKVRYSMIIRYVDENDELQERFIKFIVGDYKPTVSDFSREVIYTITSLGCTHKLVGFNYDGALFKQPMSAEFYNEMLQAFPSAKFFNYHMFDLNHQWEEAYSHLVFCRQFFSQVSNLSRLLETLPDSVASDIRIDKSHVFKSILHDIGVIYSTLNLISYDYDNNVSSVWSNECAHQAKASLTFLQDIRSIFLIKIFKKVYSDLVVFFSLQKDSLLENVAVQNFIKYEASQYFNRIYMKAQQMYDEVVTQPLSEEGSWAIRMDCKYLYDIVIKATLQFVTDKEKEFEDWKLGELTANFDTSREISPSLTYFLDMMSDFSPLFDFDSLKKQLQMTGAFQLSNFQNLSKQLKFTRKVYAEGKIYELLSLLRLVLTIPISPKDAVITCAVSKLSLYLDGKEEFYDADAFLWTEKDLLTEMQGDYYFYEDVIDHTTRNSHPRAT